MYKNIKNKRFHLKIQVNLSDNGQSMGVNIGRLVRGLTNPWNSIRLAFCLDISFLCVSVQKVCLKSNYTLRHGWLFGSCYCFVFYIKIAAFD